MKRLICILITLSLTLSIFGCNSSKQDDKTDKQVVDLIIFMGQSNMAGRGMVSKSFPEPAPELIEGAGYEFRAISDPTCLYPIEEPFGAYENKATAIDEFNYNTGMSKKTGSLVTSFVNAYYEKTQVPVVAVSASKGGTRMMQWIPGTLLLKDAIQRLTDAVEYLESNDYHIRHKYMVWCQGESDGNVGTSKDLYTSQFCRMMDAMQENGIEKCFMIQIGKKNVVGEYDSYDEIIACQKELAETEDSVIMVSTLFETMLERGLMRDNYHYYQQAYNEVGTDAGKNAAAYVNSLK